MRTLLRHTATGLYSQGTASWSNDLDRAYDFRFTDRAIQFVRTWELKEVELAFDFDDPESVISVPLETAALRYAA